MVETSTRNESVGLFVNDTTHRISGYFRESGWTAKHDETDPEWIAYEYDTFPYRLQWDDDAYEGVELIVNGRIGSRKELESLICELVRINEQLEDMGYDG